MGAESRREKKTAIAAFSLLLSLGGCAHGSAAPASLASLQQDVTFTRYSPLSRNAEIARRTLTPLTFQRGQQMLSTTGQALREQPIDLAQERIASLVVVRNPP
jgi:hypothetical protein